MTRFDFEYDDEGLPYQLWEANVSRALGGRSGQQALADMETALLELPERKLIQGYLAHEGQVCAMGALVAHKRAQDEGLDIAAVIEAMSAKVRCWCDHPKEAHGEGGCTGTRSVGWPEIKTVPCTCEDYSPYNEDGALPTAEAGVAVGLGFTVAWHLAFLNDETFRAATPEERYEKMLLWVRRAQGKVGLRDA